MSNRIPVLLVYSKDAEPRMAQLPIIPRVGDELKSFGAPAHKVHRVVLWMVAILVCISILIMKYGVSYGS